MKTRFIVVFTIIFISAAFADSPKRIISLRGLWRFEIGNSSQYAKPDYDDSSWEKIRVPDQWEDQGFPGYDGYAWYRKKFKLSKKYEDKVLMLHLGCIDDVDQVYINGHFINGRGTVSPHYISAYNQRRFYQIPREVLNFDGENVIAVQVYDEWGVGGIVSGKIGIYTLKSASTLIDLSGSWKFHSDDNMDWANVNYDDEAWETLMVPALWEDQNHWNLDGYGWYRKSVDIPESMAKENLILFIGAIDDADELYINGSKVGDTGRFPGEEYREYNRRFYNHERIYYIPSDVIKWGKKNIIAIRVYDSGGEGGIVKGPIGITSRKKFSKFKKYHRHHGYDIEDFLEDLMDY